jgi:2-acylglycerol O-acyltransferase 2
LGVLFSTVLWAKGLWRAFGESHGFETWRRYFSFKVWRDEEPFERKRNVLLALVPHGLFPLSLPLLSGVQAQVFPEFQQQEGCEIQTAVASAMLWTPVLAPMLRWLGCIPANKTEIARALRQGACIVIPDGVAGAFHSDSCEEQVYLKSRKGFIRTAIQQGSLLVPVYCFGHTQLWDVWPKQDSWIARVSRHFQFSLIWFWGEWWLPPLPRRVALTMVVGRGIPVTQEDVPSQAQVDAVHTQFTQALHSLYTRYRAEAPGYSSNKLLAIV